MEFLTADWFIQGTVPIVAVFFGVWSKVVSRNDVQENTLTKEDFALGFQILSSALLVLVTSAANKGASVGVISNETVRSKIQEELTLVPWVVAFFVLVMWGVSTLVRKWGWEEDGSLNLIWGVIVPDIIGVLFLILAVVWSS